MRKRSHIVPRIYSSDEVAAWTGRPRHFHGTLTDITNRYAPQAHVLPRCVTNSVLVHPEWCYAHEHPLRIGLKGKLYHRSDCIQPIIDGMTRLLTRHSSRGDLLGLFEPPIKRQRQTVVTATAVMLQSIHATHTTRSESARHRPPGHWKCTVCGNDDQSLCMQELDALVCPCGTVARAGGRLVSTHREKLGAAEGDDATQHADCVILSRRDRFDCAPQTSQERRWEQRSACRLSSTAASGNRGATRVGRVCDAEREIERMAHRERRDMNNLTAREELKLQRVLEALQSIFQMLNVAEAIRRVVRIEADVAWNKAIAHSRCCTASSTLERRELRMQDRSAHTIASAVFESAVERLLDGVVDIAQVERTHVLELHGRMQRLPTFNNPSARTQISTVKNIIARIYSTDVNLKAPCVAAQPPQPALSKAETCSRPSHTRLVRRLPFDRVDSESSTVGERSPAPSNQIKIRNALVKVFTALNTELRLVAREGALKAITSPGFVSTASSHADFASLSPSAIAFCLLYAVAREQARSTAKRASNLVGLSTAGQDIAINVVIAHKLALDLAVAEEVIAELRKHLPTSSVSATSHDEDEDEEGEEAGAL